jgi:poly(A) polymerase
MGRRASDIDIATAASPDVVASLFERTVPVGKQFGVLLVILGDETFEVATFRTEGPYEDGRRPNWVGPADAKADVARRDFTLNGLLYDPIRDETLDWVGGEQDIRDRLVRAIGDPLARFSEDKLRLLRAVRLAANLEFQVEDKTGQAIRQMAEEIIVVSGERIREELIKLFTGPHPDRGLLLLDQYRLLPPILPEIAGMKGVKQDKVHHPEGDVFVHTVKILSLLSTPSVSLAFAALLHDIGKPPTYSPDGPARFPNHAGVGAEMSRDILNRLRFDRRTRDRIVETVAHHMHFLNVRQMRPSKLRRFMLRDHFEEELELHRLDCLAGSGDLTNHRFVVDKLKELEKKPLPKPPLLRGKDLLRLGFHPGPQMGRILAEVEEKRLGGSLESREQAERWVVEHYDPDG